MSGACSAFIGGVFAHYYWSQLSNRIFFCPGGFVNVRRKRLMVFRWSDIEKIQQDYVKPERRKNDGGPPMTRDTTFRVIRKDGKDFGFGLETLRDHKQFARLLFAAAQAHDLPWEFYVPQ